MTVSRQVTTLSLFFFALSFYWVISDFSIWESESESEKEREAWGAFEWWYAQRALPFDLIPQQAFQHAATYANASFKKEAVREGSATFDAEWESLGPVNIGGRVLAIAINPANTDIIWAGSASGGLWKSTTAGHGMTAWNYVNTGFPTLSVSTIAIDQTNPDIMYIGTGEISRYQRPLVGTPGARASYGMGILKSTDGGNTWNTTGLTWTFPQITAIQKIVINPLNTHTLYAATSEGTYKSTNSGSTWIQSHSVLMAMDVVINPVDTTRLYVACGNLNSSPNPGIYATQDAGESWIQLQSGLPGSNFGRTSLTISPSDPTILYAGISNGLSAAIIGLYKTTNHGTAWTLATTANYVGSQGWYDNIIAVHPTDPERVYCAGFNIHRSTNGGTSLPVVSTAIVHVDHHAIAFDPNNPSIMYFGTDGGLYKSTDGGDTYTNINGGFVTTQFYPGLATGSIDTNKMVGGLQDNGTLRYDGSVYWQQIFGGDGGWCAIDPTNNNIMYYEFQYLQLYKSTNGGGTAFPIMSGLPSGSGNANFIPPFVISQSSPNVLYAGNKYVYKTTTGGTSWFSPSGATSFNGTPVACIGVSWTSPDTLLAATGTGTLGATSTFEVFASTNGGQTWSNVTASLPNRYPTDIEFDPTNSAVVYVTFSGYGTSHIFRSTNVGQTWIDISGNMPDIPHQAITVDPEYPGNLYIGTDLGVYASTNYGESWSDFSAGMPPAMVLDLVISRNNNSLRASTFGNGVYQRKLERIPTIALYSPNGNEILVSGQTHSITWSKKFLDFVKLEYTTNNGATWNLITNSAPASPQSYEWTPPDITTYQAKIRVSDVPSGIASDTSDNVFSVYFEPTVLTGWNLISVDRIVADPLPGSIFPSSISNAFDYDNGYNQQDSLLNGKGYWLKFQEPEFINLIGDSLHSDTINVVAGWNMIGSITKPLATAEIIQSPPDNIISQVYSYRNGYSTVDSLKPRRGYWVKTNSDGTLTLPNINAFSQSHPAVISSNAQRRNAITITDAGGSTQHLYLAMNLTPEASAFFEMPPLPPSGMFDARFASGKMTESFSADDTRHEIEITGAQFPLTIQWEMNNNTDGTFFIELNGSTVNLAGSGTLTAGQPANITVGFDRNAPTQKPASFSLEQNYPNPFNPSTTIRYALPAQTHVTLKVFDIQGKEVATLVDEVQEAGYKSFQLNAMEYSTGVYFYRVETATWSATKKMLLIK